jgi:hypothetical protein
VKYGEYSSNISIILKKMLGPARRLLMKSVISRLRITIDVASIMLGPARRLFIELSIASSMDACNEFHIAPLAPSLEFVLKEDMM